MPKPLSFAEDPLREWIRDSGIRRGHLEISVVYRNTRTDAKVIELDRALVAQCARETKALADELRRTLVIHGDGRDFNRSVAEAQLRFAEDQVFQPERDEFDFLVNRKLLADMGIRFWRFRSQTRVTRDPERMTNMVEKLVRVGVLTPEEGRLLAGDIFTREFRKIGDDWTKRPITLTLAGVQNGVQDLMPKRTAPDALLSNARQLLALREELRSEEERLSAGRLELARRYLEPERVTVPREEFASWFREVPDAP